MCWSPDAQHDQQGDDGKLQHSTQRIASTKSENENVGRLSGLWTERGPEDWSLPEYIDKMSLV